MPAPAAIEKNNMNIEINPQVELISIIQTISSYSKTFSFLLAKESSYYKDDVMNYFGAFKNHPAVSMFDRLSSRPGKLNFNAPSFIMLYTDNQLNLRNDIEPDSFVVGRASGSDSLNTFLALLKDFAVKSSFNKFYNQHFEYYLKMANSVAENLGTINYISELESFYGTKQKSYNIILVSLYSHVGFGNSVILHNGQREIYNVLGPKSFSNKEPLYASESYLKYKIRHEFSHPFINPLTEKHWDYIKGYSSLFNAVPEQAKKNMCGDWQECINEFLIRAITTQIGFNESKELGEALYNDEKSRGVNIIDRLLERIKYYLNNRDKFPTFDSYYKIILNEFMK